MWVASIQIPQSFLPTSSEMDSVFPLMTSILCLSSQLKGSLILGGDFPWQLSLPPSVNFSDQWFLLITFGLHCPLFPLTLFTQCPLECIAALQIQAFVLLMGLPSAASWKCWLELSPPLASMTPFSPQDSFHFFYFHLFFLLILSPLCCPWILLCIFSYLWWCHLLSELVQHISLCCLSLKVTFPK